MKRSLKGIVLASLISTQVLAGPISALAVTTETTETSETATTHATEEIIDETVTSEENEETSAANEVPKQEEPAEENKDVTEKEEAATSSEEKTESSTTPSEAAPNVVASEEKKQEVKNLIANAWATLEAGTYMGETTGPLKDALAAAELLLNNLAVTDAQLDAAIAEINVRLAALESAEPELSFALNLVNAINDGNEIISGEGFLGDKYTKDSVAARKARISEAVAAGETVLAKIIGSEGQIDSILALTNRDEVITATDAILYAIQGAEGENGLVRVDHLADILAEASKLEGAKVSGEYLQDKANFEAAFEQAANAFEHALTDQEVAEAVAALRTAMDNLHLLVVVSVVNDSGQLIVDEAISSKTGLYKTAWNVDTAAIDGYEFVSATNSPVTYSAENSAVLSGTYGDGTNNVTLVYRAIEVFEPLPFVFTDPEDVINQPATIGLSNNVGNDKVVDPKKTLPETGEKSTSMTGFGLLALAAGLVVFFKKRKTEE